MAIDESLKLFRARVRAGIKSDIQNYIGSPQVIGKTSGDSIEIAVPGLRIPRFQHSMADLFSENDNNEPPKAKHLVSLDDLMDIAAEELGIKGIVPEKVIRTVSQVRGYGAIASRGPEALRSFRKTFRNSLMRSIAAGGYQPCDPVYVTGHEKRYNIPETTEIVSRKALVINIKTPIINAEDTLRMATFNTWAALWLNKFYDEVVTEYIVHQDAARVVDRHEYYTARGESKPRFSSAYVRCLELMFDKYSPNVWNIYVFQFADGRIQEGNEGEALSLLNKWVIPRINLFSYGQVAESDESHSYKRLLVQIFGRKGKVRSFEFEKKPQIYQALGICFG